MNITNKQVVKEIIQAEQLDINTLVCDPTLVFDDLKVLKRSTSSYTIQMLVDIKKQNPYEVLLDYVKHTHTGQVFVKISFEDPLDNFAEIERTIYKYLLNLYFNRRTPNIMRYVASFKCNNFYDFINDQILINQDILLAGGYLSDEETANIKRNLDVYEDLFKSIHVLESDNSDLDTQKATFLVIERGIGKNILRLLESRVLIESEFIPIMFQLFYTLREMTLHKVRHNDLHPENIWINIHDTPLRMIYFVNDIEYVIIESKYIVKVYDFDRSAFTVGPLRNKALKELCPNYGLCSNENPYFDPHTIANLLYNHAPRLPTFVRDFCKQVIPDKFFLGPQCCVFPGRMCGKEMKHGETRCIKNFVPPKNSVRAFDELWNDTSVFVNLKKNLLADGYLSTDVPIDRKLPNDANPWLEFKKHVYIASVCTKSPMEMANLLFESYS